MKGSSNASRAATGPLPRIAPEAEPAGPMVEFGALCAPLSVQLERQGFTVSDHAELMRIEVIAKAVATVTIHGLMPPAMSDRARRKLVKRLTVIIRPEALGATPASPKSQSIQALEDQNPNLTRERG